MSFIGLRAIALIAVIWFLITPALASVGGRAKGSGGSTRRLQLGVIALIVFLMFSGVRIWLILLLVLFGGAVYLGRRVRLR